MSKCRYNLSEECHNKDCAKCVLEKIKAEIEDIKGDSIDYNASDYKFGRYQAFDIVVGIIEEKISELGRE